MFVSVWTSIKQLHLPCPLVEKLFLKIMVEIWTAVYYFIYSD